MASVCRGAAIQRGVGPGRPAVALADTSAPPSDARAKVFECDEPGLRVQRTAAERLSGAQSTGPATFGRTVVRPGDFRAHSRHRPGDFRAHSRPRCAESPLKSRCGGSSQRTQGASTTPLPFVHPAADRSTAQSTFGRTVDRPGDFRAHSRHRRRTGPHAKTVQMQAQARALAALDLPRRGGTAQLASSMPLFRMNGTASKAMPFCRTS
jgi:hypothetical protein